MKKLIAMLLVCSTAAAVALSGCSRDDNGNGGSASSDSAESEGEVIPAKTLLKATDYDISKYVTLMDDYMGLPVTVGSEYAVTDEAVQEYIETNLLPYYLVYTEPDRTTVEDGDVVNIDYVGTVNGEEFDGGSGEDYDLTIGSGEFIDGFESGLIGAEKGSTVDLNLTFPEDYGEEDLAGQPVVFTVTVNDIQVPEDVPAYDALTDDYVAEAFESLDLSTVDELKDYAKSELEEENEEGETSEIQQSVLEQLEEGCTVEFPKGLQDERVEETIASVQEAADEEEMDYTEYISSNYGYDSEDEFKDYVSETIDDQLVDELILEAIVKDQDISITTGDFDDFVDTYVSYYGFEDADEFYEMYGGEDYVRLGFAENRALDAVVKAADVTVSDEDTDTDAASEENQDEGQGQ